MAASNGHADVIRALLRCWRRFIRPWHVWGGIRHAALRCGGNKLCEKRFSIYTCLKPSLLTTWIWCIISFEEGVATVTDGSRKMNGFTGRHRAVCTGLSNCAAAIAQISALSTLWDKHLCTVPAWARRSALSSYFSRSGIRRSPPRTRGQEPS